jgi:hypothetical protein
MRESVLMIGQVGADLLNIWSNICPNMKPSPSISLREASKRGKHRALIIFALLFDLFEGAFW